MNVHNGWKTYWDYQKKVEFELPVDWIVQPAKAPKGGLGVKVRDAQGQVVATLVTGLPKDVGTKTSDECGGLMHPYIVVASEPLAGSEGTETRGAKAAGERAGQGQGNAAQAQAAQGSRAKSEDRFVYRLLKGQLKFWASYGIADGPAAVQRGVACRLWNVAEGPKGIGMYRFSDVLNFGTYGEEGLQGFGIIGDAEKHMETAKFKKIERMISSLRFT